MENQSWSFYVGGVLERRRAPILIEIVEQKPMEVFLVAVGAVACSVIADEIGDTTKRDRGFEAIGVPHDPVGHVAAVAAAGHAQPVPIDPRILLQHRVHAGHYVLVIHATPIVGDAAFELLTITGGAARIAEEDRVAAGRVNLKFVIPVHAVLSGGPSVNAEDHRIFFAGIKAYRLHQKTVNGPMIGTGVRNSLHSCRIQLIPQFRIDPRQLAFNAAVQARDVKIIQAPKIVRKIGHHTGLFVDVESVYAAFTLSNGRDVARSQVDAKDLQGAL